MSGSNTQEQRNALPIKDNKIGMMDRMFMKIGRAAGTYPWYFIFASIILTVAFASGFPKLVNENRPEKQWVPEGAPALEQKEYVDANWPATQRFNFWIAKCRQEGCNLLEPKYLQRLYQITKKIDDVVIDGDKLRLSEKAYSQFSESVWSSMGYSGNWSFDFKPDAQRKCFRFGPFCGKRTVLDIFRDDGAIINNLTMAQSLQAVNFWEGQQNFCPITIARADSPCVNTATWLSGAGANDCQEYKTSTQRDNCRKASQAYCDAVCPATCFTPPGSTQCVPRATGACGDNGCLSLVTFGTLNTSTSNTNTNGSAPESAFAFEPFKLSTVLSKDGGGGPAKSGSGQVTGASAMFGFYALSDDKSLISGSEVDPIAEEWEKQVLCVLGIKWSDRDDSMSCPEDDLLEFKPNFQRSLGDEFGKAVRGDVASLGSSYMAIMVYMTIMLSRRDSVHSMMGMALVTILIVGMSFMGCQGLGAYLGIPGNQLNNNIPFLLLGLGVDDAFVISAEFFRVASKHPENSVADNIEAAARYGGVSIFITSVTDALAFLVGSNTVLPALSGFCLFAGFGVILCFILQLTFFLPALAINARRANANRFDILCCFKAKQEHPLEEEKGCCLCCNCKSGLLERSLNQAVIAFTSKIGRLVTLTFFLFLFVMGVVGAANVYKDFKLEWFFPSDSYVNTFFGWNEEYFSSGAPVTIYTRQFDYYEAQPALASLHNYMNSSKYVDLNEPIEDWHHEFLTAMAGTASNYRSSLDSSTGLFKAGERTNYYKALHEWYSGGAGVRYRTRINWADKRCADDSIVSGDVRVWDSCNYGQGLQGARFGLTVKLEYVNKGQDRYDTMDAMRKEIGDIMAAHGGTQSFPYSFQFLYWEEVGIIDAELLRNLLVCGLVVCIIVAMMIPHPRIAVFVILSICLSVLDLVGFMYWWGVTISGVSTIYILISVGLAVDYSAHIAHMFVVSTGTARERAIGAIDRIGGSVFNGIVSTLLAVFILGFSKSYVFVVFFKALFLTVVFGGIHGLIFLPTILSMFGGDKPGPGSYGPDGSDNKVSPRDVEMVKPSAVVDAAAEEGGVELVA